MNYDILRVFFVSDSRYFIVFTIKRLPGVARGLYASATYPSTITTIYDPELPEYYVTRYYQGTIWPGVGPLNFEWEVE